MTELQTAPRPTSRATDDGARRSLVPALVAVAVLAGAIVLAAVLARDPGPATPTTDAVVSAPVGGVELVLADPPPAPTGEPVAGPAPDPRGAVTGFLTAEAAGDLETAFSYLAPEEQEVFAAPAGYVAEHADLLGVVTGFEIVSDDVSGATGTVVAEVGFRPALDTVMGLVPAEAVVTFPVLEGPDGWSIALAATTFTPSLPTDEQAVRDAEAYVEAATTCTRPPSAYAGALIGRTEVLDELCDATGPVLVGEVTPLVDPVSVQPFLAAYGPEVGVWARAVEVTAPVPLRLVLAPYGDTWTAIGVLRPQT